MSLKLEDYILGPTIPVKLILRKIINDYQELFHELLRSFLDSPEAGEKAMDKLIQKDSQLQEAIHILKEHQKFQKNLNAIDNIVKKQNQVLIDLVSKLKKAENILEQIVENGHKRIENSQKTDRPIDIGTLVKYAGVASYSVAPPPNWQEEQQLAPFAGPFPSKEIDLIPVRSRLVAVQQGITEEDGNEAENQQNQTQTATQSQMATSVDSEFLDEQQSDVSFFSSDEDED